MRQSQGAARPAFRRRSALAVLVAPLVVGCAPPAGPTFSLEGTSIVWPKPPDAPRIRYLGEIRGEASLGVSPRGWDALRAVLEGPRPMQSFATPVAVTVDGNRLFVADPSHPSGPLVHLLDLDARSYGQLREAGGRPLQWPIDVAASSGRLAIADARRAAVFVRYADSAAWTTIGSGSLKRPAGVAWCGDELWVLDAAGHCVVVFDRAGRERLRVGGRGAAEGQFNFPSGLFCDEAGPGPRGGELHVGVADAMNFRVQILDAAGRPVAAFGRKGDAAGDFSLPRDIALDSAGHVYVLDNQFENIQVFDRVGQLLMALGGGGGEAGRFNLPAGIWIDADDRIWVADTYNRRIQAFQYLHEASP